ncbi:MAG: metallophosphoesterase [Clostridia bacterium]|nr:metallophosphoesterase [Clostridia bacterium]
MLKLMITLLLCLMIATGAAAERIWISTDLHISGGGDVQREAFEAVLSKPEDGDILILMGDLANSGHLAEHRMITDGLNGIADGVQVYVLPGNHDLSAEMTPDGFRTHYHAYGYDSAFAVDPDSLSYAVMTPDGVCLMMLDTNAWDEEKRAVLHGGISDGVLRWTASVLERIPENTPVFAFGHHPLYPFEGTDATTGAEQMMQVLDTGNVLAYLCGHRHSNATEGSGRKRQIMTGVPWSYPAYLGLVELSGDGFTYTVQTVFEAESDTYRTMRALSAELAERMAAGSLAGTSFEGDAEATAWFMRFFAAVLDGKLSEIQEVLRREQGYEHWKQAEVRSAVKPWIIATMESTHEDYHRIWLGQADEDE